MTPKVRILEGDVLKCLKLLDDKSIHCCVTSPPYFCQRNYEVKGQIGLEKTPNEFIDKLVQVFREVRRVLRDDGTLWVNMGDTYNQNHRGKADTASPLQKGNRGTVAFMGRSNQAKSDVPDGNRLLIPARLALALQADGWILRDEIVWAKKNVMPESVTNRCTRSHEMIYMFTKNKNKYYYDYYAIKENSIDPESLNGRRKRNDQKLAQKKTIGSRMREGFSKIPDGAVYLTRHKRSVWEEAVASTKDAHFATFPKKLILPCILAGTSEKGCCANCGAPLRRIVKRKRIATRPGTNTKIKAPGKNSRVFKNRDPAHPDERRNRDDYLPSSITGNRDPERHITIRKTVGWEKTCDCDTDKIVPCTVLDCFGGSGTSGAVAVSKGRNAVLIELNPEYAKLCEWKTKKALRRRGFGF